MDSWLGSEGFALASLQPKSLSYEYLGNLSEVARESYTIKHKRAHMRLPLQSLNF